MAIFGRICAETLVTKLDVSHLIVAGREGGGGREGLGWFYRHWKMGAKIGHFMDGL